MIEGLEQALAGSRERAVPELQLALDEAFAGETPVLAELRTFKRGVHRLTVTAQGLTRSVVVKRLGRTQARANEHVYERWLPAEGLAGGCPALLGRAAERRGAFLWHVYEDIGDRALATDPPPGADVGLVVGFIARLHARFAAHPMLAEARSIGGDLGIHAFATNVGDALHGVQALLRSEPPASGNAALLQRLRERMSGLLASLPRRAESFRAHAGPETLLHGDLWTTNAFVRPGGTEACLIDWDHAGAGPACYDLSTFLLRFPAGARAQILERYREAMIAAGATVAASHELNVLFETAELGRYANRLGWLALALLEGGNDWAWEKVAAVEEWFDQLQPVLPAPGDSPARAK